MPKKPIGDFASVGEAKAYCESLLQRGCEPLTDEEHRRVSLLMKHHPDYSEDWQLCHHTVLNGQYYSLCVFGEEKHWPTSYRKFFMAEQTSNNLNLSAAYRHAIRCQIEAYRASHGGIGEVDHKPPGFSKLTKQFEQELGCKPTPVYDTTQGDWILPEGIIGMWQQFHREHACLQLLPHNQHKELTDERRWAS